MSLINCSECNNIVSTKAEMCPNCGNPIVGKKEFDVTGTHVKTIQKTSKKFKIQTLLSTFLIIIGIIWGMIIICGQSQLQEPQQNYNLVVVPSLFFNIGIIWYIINRIRIWWHHK